MNRHLQKRPRRLRRGELIRDLVADVAMAPHHLVLPLFVCDGQGVAAPIDSMPGVCRYSPDQAVAQIRGHVAGGLTQFILFAVVDHVHKDVAGRVALGDHAVTRTLQAVRDAGIDAVLHADLCYCEFTSHGHCGVLDADPSVTVDNDATLDLLAQQAVVLAEAGADVVAPSGMMDGMVGAIRQGLDQAGKPHTIIMSYTVKYASAMYGPFRDAAGSSMSFGDRRSYQMDYRRGREWRTELSLDVEEGADIVMVKPAMTYLDIIRQVRDATSRPVAAYHVSGEYSMLHAAAARGWLDLRAAALESTYAIRRAGADLILTYFAPRLLEWL